MNFGATDTQKCFAWLFGYSAHVVADFTVHPVIDLRVGPYEQNKGMQGLGEMNEDFYIFHKLGLGAISTAEYIKRCGIESWAHEADWTPGVDRKWHLAKPPVPAEFAMGPAQKDKP